ncbi:MAG: hypothetical protein CL910_11970 [Deltaproteobacteria bacterium]|jgi:alkylation response protein AidB-like acyl-CoA dehydrogenase|nr:hypothetical protein [Deltaproteobacteria bacterium]
MQFELDDERSLLRSSTRELLEGEAALEDTRSLMEDASEGYSKAFFGQLAELGYFGLLLSEDEGGADMGALGLAAVLAEMGRVALPGPFLESVVASEILRRAEGDAAAALLARVVAGDALVVLADREGLGGAAPAPIATRLEAGQLTGVKTFVPFGEQADALIVTTADGLALAQRPDAGWSASPLPTLDHAQRFAQIELGGPAELLAVQDGALDAAGRLGTLGAAALLFGLMERSLEIALAYMMERQAFGSPLAGFQALQHRAADMLIKVETTRSAVFRAAWALDQRTEDAPFLVAVAKAWAGDAGRLVCGESIQVHGGVGYTWEYDPHVYLKRVKTLEAFFGSTREQLEAALHLAPVAAG